MYKLVAWWMNIHLRNFNIIIKMGDTLYLGVLGGTPFR
jgi:hypothetical protein